MRHHHSRPPRTSRILLMILGLTVAVGVFTFVHRYRENRAVAGESVNPAPVGTAAASLAPTDEQPAATVTQTPTVLKSPTTPKSLATTRPGSASPTTRAAIAKSQAAAKPAVAFSR